MTGQPILIVFESRFGQTAKIAARLEARLRESGFAVETRDVRSLPPGFDAGPYRTVVLGGSVRFGRHARVLVAFARAVAGARGGHGGAFFSVCGAASGSTPEGDGEARGYRLRFLARTGWTPDLDTSFGGAVVYSKYGPLTRWMMKRIQRSKGLDTDTSRDFEYTDWDAVDRFAGEVAALAGAGGSGRDHLRVVGGEDRPS